MANGHKYGVKHVVQSVAVGTASVIAIGDLVKATASTHVPIAAADTTWDTNIATTQEAFHDLFLGVAEQASRVGDILPIRVAQSGVFEFDCASATFKVGDLVGPAKQSGDLLESQKVVAVATANLAIGRVAKNGTSVTKVWVEIDATLRAGGPRAIA